MRSHPPSLLFPLILVFYEIATYLSNDMYLPALPQMMNDLGLTTKQAQLTLTCWFLGSAALPLIMGTISDRFGRRSVLLTGGVVYILSSLVCAIATDIYILLIARVIEGAMIASMLVPGYACIHESYNEKEAIKILALMSSIVVLAPAFGPLLGSIILYVANWRFIFLFIAIWSFITILLLYQYMPETLPAEKRIPFHFIDLMKSYMHVFMNKQFMLLMLILGFIFAGFIVWITAGPLLIIQNFKYSVMAFGMIQAAIFIAYIAASRMVKYLIEWKGVRKLIYLGVAITLSGGILMLLFAAYLPYSLPAFLLAMTVYSFGAGFCFAPLNRSIIDSSDQPMGIRVALFTVMFMGFAVIGSGAASLFFNGTVTSLAYLIGFAVIIASFCNICLLIVDKKEVLVTQ